MTGLPVLQSEAFDEIISAALQALFIPAVPQICPLHPMWHVLWFMLPSKMEFAVLGHTFRP